MLKTIRLTPEDVKHFVDVASKCDFDIDICYNRYVVDAKSFLGVYGLVQLFQLIDEGNVKTTIINSPMR